MSSAFRDRVREAAVRFADELVTIIETSAGATEWVDQYDSPLGRRRHLAAVRRGDLPASKEGRRVLVRRSDLDDYIRRNAVLLPTEHDEADDVLREMGFDVKKSA